MKTRKTDNFKLGDRVVFRKYSKFSNEVGTVVGIDELEQAKETIKEESKRPFISTTKDINEYQEKVWKDINKIWF